MCAMAMFTACSDDDDNTGNGKGPGDGGTGVEVKEKKLVRVELFRQPMKCIQTLVLRLM